MKRSEPLKRKTELARVALERRPTVRRRRPISPASPAQRAKVTDAGGCLVCGNELVDPAHLIDRSLLGEGQDDPRAVVALCRLDHRLYDEGQLDLLPYLWPRYAVELAFAVERFNLIPTLRRVTNRRDWVPIEEAA